MQATGRTILSATLICGVLDIASAFAFSALRGTGPVKVLQFVASGPFGEGMADAGAIGALIGLIVHFAIMAVMVAVFVLAAQRLPFLKAHPLLAGIAYGIALYLIMYWIVMPLRWPGPFPSLKLRAVASALFSHIVCVGIPMAIITVKGLGRGPRATAATA